MGEDPSQHAPFLFEGSCGWGGPFLPLSLARSSDPIVLPPLPVFHQLLLLNERDLLPTEEWKQVSLQGSLDDQEPTLTGPTFSEPRLGISEEAAGYLSEVLVLEWQVLGCSLGQLPEDLPGRLLCLLKFFLARRTSDITPMAFHLDAALPQRISDIITPIQRDLPICDRYLILRVRHIGHDRHR